MKTLRIFTLLYIVAHAFTVQAGQGDLSLIKDLAGYWQFSIGDREEWISPKYDDSKWESIKVPSPWEDQGFNGYNGYAFYRKKVVIPDELRDRMLYLFLGYIDDVDEVYFNGHKIGSTGSFPPQYISAYNAERKYYIPEEIINFNGTNLIAVKVYDSYMVGGIVSGKVGIFGGKMVIKLDVNMQNKWKFHTGDNFSYKEPDYNDSGWDEIFVPAKWEDQGYRDYDGYAWYRKTFVYRNNAANDNMVMLLGKIDDVDQLYINGILVGSTGKITSKTGARIEADQEYNAFRGYYIPAGILKNNQKNVIAVRVYDKGGAGGIYEGPVGLVTQSRYIDFWRSMKNRNK